jgi:hypothetical protein
VIKVSKIENRIHGHVLHSDLNIYPLSTEPKEWKKIVAKNRRTPAVFAIKVDELPNLLVGIRKSAYDHNATHMSLLEALAVGGGKMQAWNENQYKVIKKLSRDEKVESVYFYHSSGKDCFVVVTPDDEPETTMYFARLYWDIFDQNPEYLFEIRPVSIDYFNVGSLPEGAVKC